MKKNGENPSQQNKTTRTLVCVCHTTKQVFHQPTQRNDQDVLLVVVVLIVVVDLHLDHDFQKNDTVTPQVLDLYGDVVTVVSKVGQDNMGLFLSILVA